MAVQAKNARGPATGMAKTPAPDAVTSPRSGAGQGYGANGPIGNASSVEPGKRVLSPLAQNLESSVDDDGVLQSVIKRGARMDDTNFQTRVIDKTGYPAAHGQSSRQVDSGSPGGSIPKTIGASSAPLPKDPAA
jgi:hypothetical protein